MICLIFTGALSDAQLIVAPGTPAALEYIFLFHQEMK